MIRKFACMRRLPEWVSCFEESMLVGISAENTTSALATCMHIVNFYNKHELLAGTHQGYSVNQEFWILGSGLLNNNHY